MPKVLNKYKDNITCEDAYIGRGSQWGNPFQIGKNGTREEVIEKYKSYYFQAGLYGYVKELRGKNLVCFCSPQACHGDFLLEQANKRFKFILRGAK